MQGAANRSMRTGKYVRQPTGYSAFIPAALPFKPSIEYDDELIWLLSNADQAIGRLDAASDILPNPDLFVRMYVTQEAVASSKMEGVTQASLSEVLEYNAKYSITQNRSDIKEVWNYVEAMNYGLERVKELPLSNRLVREIHEILLSGVRGDEWLPGEFRTSQNWIGPPGCLIGDAVFVPPPVHEMLTAIGDLETFIHTDAQIPDLVRAGLIHYQFETIHPFLDGNGRIGRLLVTFFLCQAGVLKRSLLYLSTYCDKYKERYVERLQAGRDNGAVEEWMKFFLRAIWRVSESAAKTAHSILEMRESHRDRIQENFPGTSKGFELLDYLFANPITTATTVASDLGTSYVTSNNLISSFNDLGIVSEITGRERYRLFAYTPYIDLMEAGLDFVDDG